MATIAVGLVVKSDTRDPRRIYYKLTDNAGANSFKRDLSAARTAPRISNYDRHKVGHRLTPQLVEARAQFGCIDPG
jgi:hypothetical protein